MSSGDDATPLPLVADCRVLPATAPLRWLAAGWGDLRAAPRVSLSLGVVTTVVSWLIAAATWRFGDLGLYLGLLSGFVFLGPLIALTFYAASVRLAISEPVTVRLVCADTRMALGDTMVFAVVLLIVFLVWARAAAMVHIFFPLGGHPSLIKWATFLGIGSAVGAIFCAVIYMASAFSLPMMLDRETDTVTAVLSSVNATLRNKPAMLVWAVIIVLAVVLSVATFFVGLAVLMPWLGHATWHAYLDTVDASAWPRRQVVSAP